MLATQRLHSIAGLIRMAAIALLGAVATGDAADDGVRMVKEESPQGIKLFVENSLHADITLSLSITLSNAVATFAVPQVSTFSGRKKTLAVTVTPKDRTRKWSFSSEFSWVFGSLTARHDDRVPYALPYAPGSAFRVGQGFNGPFSHTGESQFAVDWLMPEGTRFCAARAGAVVAIKQDTATGGDDPKFKAASNYIYVQHADGTIGEYAHLQRNGALVKLGQPVKAGDVLGLSGNTGFSTGPHLHFMVFKAKNGKERESVPIRFRTSDDAATTLDEGKRYTAP